MAEEEERPDSPQNLNLKRTRTPFFTRHPTNNPADEYDHEIALVDTTLARPTNLGNQTPELRQNGEDEVLGRRRDRVKASVRGEYNRQKWRRYQKERTAGRDEDGDDDNNNNNNNNNNTTDDPDNVPGNRLSKDTYGVSTIRRNYDRVRDKIPRGQKVKAKGKSKEEFEVDILYENQRGLFFCGIPLYSHQSLLNFDPPAWQTREFRESPVNITNAQPPDPTWTWAWRCWYVDMSHDVDEEGWEYSLSFQQGFAWHGTHPWFHSFVRRRRWLRKRVKMKMPGKDGSKDALQEGHKLNRDYFTIHSASREASSVHVPTIADVAGASTQRYSIVTSKSYLSEDESEAAEELPDINSLLKSLRNATVDRKKLASVRNFLSNAGSEVHYLPDKVPEIMSLFVYQTSRRQVLSELQQAAGTDKYLSPDPAEDVGSDTDGAADQRPRIRRPSPSSLSAAVLPSPGGSRAQTPTFDAKADRIESLRRAIEVAQDCVTNFEYWSDVKKTHADAEALDVPPPPPGGPDLAPTAGDKRPPLQPRQKSEGRVQIKGIPEGARIGQEVGIARRVTLEMRKRGEAAPEIEGKDKGKAPEKASEESDPDRGAEETENPVDDLDMNEDEEGELDA